MANPVEADDPLYTIYAEQSSKLDETQTLADRLEPVRVRSKADALVERR